MEPAVTNIEHRIFTIRGIQVMLDSDLAELFTTETKFINRAVKRNIHRFPDEFMISLNEKEWENLRCQNGTSSFKHGGRRNFPTAFSEQGIAMLSAVLHTDVAISVSIQIMLAFVSMRKTLGQLHGVIQRLEGLEVKQLRTDQKLEQVYKALESPVVPKQGIFYEGQLFDAHVFASDLIKSAKTSIVLVDNYVDEITLLLLSKRSKGVNCTVHSRIRESIKLDLVKHNKQYPTIELIENRGSHNRFLIIDDQYLYHFGASLKDLGTKCFAFNQMNDLLSDFKSLFFKIEKNE